MRRKGATGSAAAPPAAADRPLPGQAFRPPGAVSQKVLDRLFALADRSNGLQLGARASAAWAKEEAIQQADRRQVVATVRSLAAEVLKGPEGGVLRVVFGEPPDSAAKHRTAGDGGEFAGGLPALRRK